jgi:hypothetical protein
MRDLTQINLHKGQRKNEEPILLPRSSLPEFHLERHHLVPVQERDPSNLCGIVGSQHFVLGEVL